MLGSLLKITTKLFCSLTTNKSVERRLGFSARVRLYHSGAPWGLLLRVLAFIWISLNGTDFTRCSERRRINVSLKPVRQREERVKGRERGRVGEGYLHIKQLVWQKKEMARILMWSYFFWQALWAEFSICYCFGHCVNICIPGTWGLIPALQEQVLSSGDLWGDNWVLFGALSSCVANWLPPENGHPVSVWSPWVTRTFM